MDGFVGNVLVKHRLPDSDPPHEFLPQCSLANSTSELNGELTTWEVVSFFGGWVRFQRTALESTLQKKKELTNSYLYKENKDS